MSGMVWRQRPETLLASSATQPVRLITDAIEALAKSYAPQIETWMKENAPWTDRTGNARQSLYTRVDRQPQQITITLDHGVNYGVYLEFRNAGRYAIIDPALDHWVPIIFGGIRKLVRP